MRVVNSIIFDGYQQTTNETSDPFWIGHFNGYSISITVSNGSGFGATAKLQACNDMGRDSIGSAGLTNWVDLPNSGATANISLSSDGTSMWNVDGAFYKWVRVYSTFSSGWATLTIRANGKGPGAE